MMALKKYSVCRMMIFLMLFAIAALATGALFLMTYGSFLMGLLAILIMVPLCHFTLHLISLHEYWYNVESDPWSE